MHTQRAVSEQILEAGGQYLWPVKDNQERLRDNIQRLFVPEQPKPGFGKIKTDFETAKQVSYGHGRVEIRTIQTSEMLNDYLDWPGVGQVYQLEREFLWVRQARVYKTSYEVEYGITSLSRKQAPAIKILNTRRQHWCIETGLHYRRDVTFHEDATRMTVGAAGSILSMVHNLVLALLKLAGFSNSARGRRWFEGHLEDAFALLISGNLLS
jgi:predicted transposase YbfD/YdcC